MNNNHVCIGYFSRLPERLINAIFLSFIPFLWIVVCNMIIIVNVLASRARCVSSSARITSRHVTVVACLFSLKFLVLTLPLSVFNVVTWYDIKDAYLYVRPTYVLLRYLFTLLYDIYQTSNVVTFLISGKSFRRRFIKLLKC